MARSNKGLRKARCVRKHMAKHHKGKGAARRACGVKGAGKKRRKSRR